MIYEDLRFYLVNNTTPEVVELFDDAVNVFTALEIETSMVPFEQYMEANRELPSDAVMMGLHDVLDDSLIAVLVQMGVSVGEEASTSALVKIAKTMNYVPLWEDKEAIARIMECDEENNEEKLASLCAYLCGGETENYLPYIASVKPELIKVIAELSKDQPETNERSYAEFAEQYHKLKILRQNAPAWVDRSYLDQPGLIGTDMAVLMREFLDEQEQYFVDIVNPEVIQGMLVDMLYIACMSKEGPNGLAPFCAKLWASLNLPLATTVAYNQMISRLLQELKQ